MSAGRRRPFVAVDGINGAGKSTLCDLLLTWFRQRGEPCLPMPPFSWLDFQATRVVDDSREERRLVPPTELLDAMVCDRRTATAEVLVPARRTMAVLADRYILTDLVYNEVLHGVAAKATIDAYRRADIAMPDMTVFIRVDVEVACSRISARARIDSRRWLRFYENESHLTRLAEGFERVVADDVIRESLHIVTVSGGEGSLAASMAEIILPPLAEECDG